jgi:predicted DNA binding protein
LPICTAALPPVNKATIARDMGISRETLYQYLRAAA